MDDKCLSRDNENKISELFVRYIFITTEIKALTTKVLIYRGAYEKIDMMLKVLI